MIGGKGKKCLGISELPIVDSFSCGKEIGSEGMYWAEQVLSSCGHCSFGGSSPPSHWMAPLSELFLLLSLLPDELAYVKRYGQTQL